MTEYVTEVDQYVQSRVQKMGRQFLTIAYDWTNEQGVRSTAIACRALATGPSSVASSRSVRPRRSILPAAR